MAIVTVILACLGYVILGSVVVCWRAQHRNRESLKDDVALLAVLLLWPLWVVAYQAHLYGWRNR